MNHKNLIVYVSSRNNYEMLNNEVFKNINFDGFEFINVDDQSDHEEKVKGKNTAKIRDMYF